MIGHRGVIKQAAEIRFAFTQRALCALLPGNIDTQRLAFVIDASAKNANASRDKVEQSMKDEIPMKRFGEPSEIAAVAAFLASPAGSYVSGVSIPVDGDKTGSI